MLLHKIKADIFDYTKEISTTMKKYFKTIYNYRDINTTTNISFFNFRAEKINKIIQKKVIKPSSGVIKYGDFFFYEGLELICRKHYKASKIRLYTNYTYIIKTIDNKKFSIIEPNDNVTMTFDIKMLSYFKLPYCVTCHSVQELSIDEEITLLDCKTPYVDREYIWTGISRLRDLKKITYFEHSKDEVGYLEESKLKQYLYLKIERYKQQDNEANQKINKENFIDVDSYVGSYVG